MGLHDFRLHKAERLANGLLGLAFNAKRDMWSWCKLRGKPKKCWSCGRTMTPGEEAFRPMGNHDYRMMRLCVPCVDDMAPETEVA